MNLKLQYQIRHEEHLFTLVTVDLVAVYDSNSLYMTDIHQTLVVSRVEVDEEWWTVDFVDELAETVNYDVKIRRLC